MHFKLTDELILTYIKENIEDDENISSYILSNEIKLIPILLLGFYGMLFGKVIILAITNKNVLIFRLTKTYGIDKIYKIPLNKLKPFDINYERTKLGAYYISIGKGLNIKTRFQNRALGLNYQEESINYTIKFISALNSKKSVPSKTIFTNKGMDVSKLMKIHKRKSRNSIIIWFTVLFLSFVFVGVSAYNEELSEQIWIANYQIEGYYCYRVPFECSNQPPLDIPDNANVIDFSAELICKRSRCMELEDKCQKTCIEHLNRNLTLEECNQIDVEKVKSVCMNIFNLRNSEN